MTGWYNDYLAIADDSMLGRGVGQLGEKLASDYILERLVEEGITPYIEGYFQEFGIVTSELITDDFSFTSLLSEMGLSNQNAGKHKLILNDDISIINKNGLNEVDLNTGLVYVNHGVRDRYLELDDYKGLSVKGKIVVFIEGLPLGSNLDWANGDILLKVENAKSLGASGVIVLPYIKKGSADNLFSNYASHFRQLIHYTAKLADADDGDDFFSKEKSDEIPVFLLNPNSLYKIGLNLTSVLEDMYDEADRYKVDTWLKSSRKHPVAKKLEAEVDIKFSVEKKNLTSRNVVGMIESEGSDKYVVVSAHYDHLGISVPVEGDSIYNGAYDNAMGVSALIELGKRLNQRKDELKSNIVLLFTTGEEKGLLGSQAFLRDLDIYYSQITANINIDGLSAFGLAEEFFVVGESYSELGEIATEIIESSGFEVTTPSESGVYEDVDYFQASEQYVFALEGIPSVLISDGIGHEGIEDDHIGRLITEYSTNYYHTPFDDIMLPFSLEGADRHISLLEELAIRASKSTNIEWATDSPFSRDIKTALK
ncbi:MAG: M20/M25/M40 family metallo-hydrolase [Candidatus Kapaibacteriales bacterium]